jgi:hypothetical protein
VTISYRAARPLLAIPALALGVLLSACGSTPAPATTDASSSTSASAATATPAPTRSPPNATTALGLTPYSHDGGIEGLLAAFEIIERDANLAAMHFDGGISWPELLAGPTWSDAFDAEARGKASVIPDEHLVYLAVTPISFERNGLAAYYGTVSGQPLPAPWDTYAFNHPDVIEAYGRFVEQMVDLYQPDYLAYAIEPNLLATNAPEQWPAFLELAAATYARIKASHPDLPVFVTLQAEVYYDDPVTQTAIIEELLPVTDLIAISAYPFIRQLEATALPTDYFTAFADLAPEKDFAIAETSWPAEPIGAPYPVAIPADDAAQLTYVERLLADAHELDAAFVVWFFPRDFDAQWDTDLAQHPAAPTLRLWRDTGLYAGDGQPRPALEAWRAALDR